MNKAALEYFLNAARLGAISVLDREGVRDLTPDLLTDDGVFRLKAASYYTNTTMEERALFGHRHGMYCLPTVELVSWLVDFIGPRSAVEIGSGTGALADFVGILATDNYMQTWPDIVKVYTATGQPVINYGQHVAKMDANHMAETMRPDVIVGAWITHKYDPTNHDAGGNMYGPDLPALLHHCEHLVLICNEHTHAMNPMFNRPHQVLIAPWIVSRAANGSRDFIAIWEGDRHAKRTQSAV